MDNNPQRRPKARLAALFTACLAALSGPAQARDYTADPSDYVRYLRELQPGDTLHLQSGEYRHGLRLHYLEGTSAQPIVVSGTPGQTVFLGRQGHNTVSLLNAAYVAIRDVKLDGLGLPVDGVKCEGHADWSHHITLENLQIVGHGHDQQTVGISTKCPAWDWVIRGNVIVGAGTGIYLGNSDGSDPFVSGLIEGNVIVDTLGYNLQIKHQKRRPELVSMPSQPNATVIRGNVFGKARNASTGAMARPNVLVGHWPLEDKGSEDAYWIANNLFFENPSEALFQGEGRLVLHDNLFINTVGDGVHIQPHNDIPRHVVVANNLVLASGDGLRVLSKAERPSQVWVDGNVVAAGSPLIGGFRSQNHAYSFFNQSDPLAEWERSPPARDWVKQRLLAPDEQTATAMNALIEDLIWPEKAPPTTEEGAWWRLLIQKLREWSVPAAAIR
jgi:Right handed beta helix region